jgi:hypothetical protein
MPNGEKWAMVFLFAKLNDCGRSRLRMYRCSEVKVSNALFRALRLTNKRETILHTGAAYSLYLHFSVYSFLEISYEIIAIPTVTHPRLINLIDQQIPLNKSITYTHACPNEYTSIYVIYAHTTYIG